MVLFPFKKSRRLLKSKVDWGSCYLLLIDFHTGKNTQECEAKRLLRVQGGETLDSIVVDAVVSLSSAPEFVYCLKSHPLLHHKHVFLGTTGCVLRHPNSERGRALVGDN